MYNQTNYVQAALQIQRWRDFGSQVQEHRRNIGMSKKIYSK
jgi:hypothetical protein